VYATASDEHDEYGHITEELHNRRRMMQKRMKKLETARHDIHAPTRYGPAEAPMVLAGWGPPMACCARWWTGWRTSAPGALLRPVALPAEAAAAALQGRKVVTVETNYTGQFKRLLQGETCIEVGHSIRRYDGRPFSPEDILDGLKEVR